MIVRTIIVLAGVSVVQLPAPLLNKSSYLDLKVDELKSTAVETLSKEGALQNQ